MLKVEVEALVTYTCCLERKDEEKVKEYAKENNCSLKKAIEDLHFNDEIDLYKTSVETDFDTQDIKKAIEE